MSNEPGNRYNIQLINALVLYVGTQAIAHIHNKGSTPSMSTITHSAHMDIFQNLAVDLDTEGRGAALKQIEFQDSVSCYLDWHLLLMTCRNQVHLSLYRFSAIHVIVSVQLPF